MNIQPITMEQQQAREAYLEYRREVRARYGSVAGATVADRTTLAAYRELGRGRQLLDLHKVMREVGHDAQFRPVLAICRAGAQWCACRRFRDGGVLFRVETPDLGWADRDSKTRGDVRLAPGTLPGLAGNSWTFDVRAMVPEVPIHLRPAKLEKYHVLWEATWEPVPPADPFLLRHLTGSLYTVLAQWDLTPIEQLVLGALRSGSAS